MAARASSESPKVNSTRLFGLTKIAVDTWLVDSGKVEKRGDIKLNRTLDSYGLKSPSHLNKLSTHVIDVVKAKTGVKFQLTAAQFPKFGHETIDAYINGSVEQFMAALPGEPTTLPSKSKKAPKVPVKRKALSALPGEPTTLPSRPPKR